MQYVCTVRHVAGADGSCICNVVDCGDCFLWLAEIVRGLGCFYLPAYIRGPQCLGVRGPFAVEKRNEAKRKGKWKINAKLPGRWLRPSFTASDSQFPLPDRMPVEAGLVRKRIPGTQHRQGPSPMVPQASQRPLIARSLRFVWHAPLSRSKGGAPAGGQGEHILTGAPRCISVCPASFLSPTLRQSHQGIWAGNRGCISRCRLFWSRVSQMVRPRPPPPSPFFFNHFLHPPSRPQILHLAPRTPPPPRGGPSPLAQPFHASLHRMRSWDRQCVAICQSHQAPSTTLPFHPPLVSSSASQRAWMGPSLVHGQPRKGYFAICNLQSAPASRHRSAW